MVNIVSDTSPPGTPNDIYSHKHWHSICEQLQQWREDLSGITVIIIIITHSLTLSFGDKMFSQISVIPWQRVLFTIVLLPSIILLPDK